MKTVIALAAFVMAAIYFAGTTTGLPRRTWRGQHANLLSANLTKWLWTYRN